jgi:hypothetical protein
MITSKLPLTLLPCLVTSTGFNRMFSWRFSGIAHYSAKLCTCTYLCTQDKRLGKQRLHATHRDY